MGKKGKVSFVDNFVTKHPQKLVNNLLLIPPQPVVCKTHRLLPSMAHFLGIPPALINT